MDCKLYNVPSSFFALIEVCGMISVGKFGCTGDRWQSVCVWSSVHMCR